MSEKILIRSTSDGLIILPAIDAFGKQTIIVNGTNEVDADVWTKCRSAVQYQLDNGILTELHAKVSEVKADGKTPTLEVKGKAFGDLSVSEQQALIADCNSVALLEEWSRIPKIQQTAVSISIGDRIKKVNENLQKD